MAWLREIDRWFADTILPYAANYRAYARKPTGNAPDAEDLVQEAYAKVLAVPDWRRLEAPERSVMTIIRNLAIERFRRAKVVGIRQIGQLEQDTLPDPSPDAYVQTSNPDQTFDPVNQNGNGLIMPASAREQDATLKEFINDARFLKSSSSAARATIWRSAVHVASAPRDAVLSLAGDGAKLASLDRPQLGATEARREIALVADGVAHWLRVDVRSADGKLLLLGNPIYLRPRP